MNQSDAADAAKVMETFYAAEDELEHDVHMKYGAIFDQAYEHLPDGALTALVQRLSDNAPMLVALKSNSLYMLTVQEQPAGTIGQPKTNCTMIHVQPGAAVVESEPRFRTRSGTGPAPRTTTWRFKFTDGPILEFDAHFHPDQQSDGREALGKALATVLGWDLPQVQAVPLVAMR
ncbi:MAG TPA: hypothetical protein VIS51_12275 [Solirubrobacterales bacterium]